MIHPLLVKFSLKNADYKSFEIWVQQMKYLNRNEDKKSRRRELM